MNLMKLSKNMLRSSNKVLLSNLHNVPPLLTPNFTVRTEFSGTGYPGTWVVLNLVDLFRILLNLVRVARTKKKKSDPTFRRSSLFSET